MRRLGVIEGSGDGKGSIVGRAGRGDQPIATICRTESFALRLGATNGA
jgi:hypothetical protein